MLAKAVAGMNRCTFFNCSASALISKWRGESEKIIKCLFDAARITTPSIIFFDEIDSILSTRDSDSEHEASRRMKTEIFSRMDGIQTHGGPSNDQQILVLATTNRPWDLDTAILRRLEKRIYIPLPDKASRKKHFELALRNLNLESQVDELSQWLADTTDGFTGSDITVVVREAAMNPMRRLLSSHSIQQIQEQRESGTLKLSQVTDSSCISS